MKKIVTTIAITMLLSTQAFATASKASYAKDPIRGSKKCIKQAVSELRTAKALELQQNAENSTQTPTSTQI